MRNMLSKFSFFPDTVNQINTILYLYSFLRGFTVALQEHSMALVLELIWDLVLPVQGHRCAVWTQGPVWPSPLWLRSALHPPHQNRKRGLIKYPDSTGGNGSITRCRQQQNHRSIQQTKRFSTNDEQKPKKHPSFHSRRLWFVFL